MRARLAGSRRPSASATNQAVPPLGGALLGALWVGALCTGALCVGILAAGGALALVPAAPMPTMVFRAGRAATTLPPSDGPRCVPSTMMDVPQCLHVMRARLPRTRSSGTAYLAGQAVQATF